MSYSEFHKKTNKQDQTAEPHYENSKPKLDVLNATMSINVTNKSRQHLLMCRVGLAKVFGFPCFQCPFALHDKVF